MPTEDDRELEMAVWPPKGWERVPLADVKKEHWTVHVVRAVTYVGCSWLAAAALGFVAHIALRLFLFGWGLG